MCWAVLTVPGAQPGNAVRRFAQAARARPRQPPNVRRRARVRRFALPARTSISASRFVVDWRAPQARTSVPAHSSTTRATSVKSESGPKRACVTASMCSTAAPPSIGFCRHGEVIPYEGESLIVDPDLGAAYDKERRHIYLAQPWDATNTRDLGTLLHELIHDVQYRNRDWPCWQKTEWEAYKLQEAWLAERGESADFNWALILMLSRCSQNHHP